MSGSTGDETLRRPACPGCGEPWLRPTQLPECGEHQTMVRMAADEDLRCQQCGASMLRMV